jgi:two-component sensor histidine kinase
MSRLLRSGDRSLDDAERLRVATEVARIGIWEWNTTTNEMDYSPIARVICGFPAEGPITFAQVRDITHPDDLPRTMGMANRALDPALREKAPYRYRINRQNDHQLRWILAYGEAQFSSGDQRATRYLGTIQDITDEIAAEEALIESEARLRLAIEVADMAVWEVNLDTFEVTGSPQLNALCGFPTNAHPSFADFQSRYAPGEFDRVQRLGADAAARGESHIQTVIHQVWPDATEKWLLLRAQVAPQITGSGERVIGVLIDVTEQQRAERRLELVAREMRHRVKNVLAVANVLARKTFAAADRESLHRFAERLAALSVATDMLGGSEADQADLRQLIEAVLKPHVPEGRVPFTFLGPEVKVGPKTASNLAMAIHELATNASKYGALSVDGGGVSIEWDGDPLSLRLKWQEHDGPIVSPPTRSGFGSLLISQALFPAPNRSDLRFEPDGVQCELFLLDGILE